MAAGDGTIMQMTTPAGSNTLLAVSMHGEEAISTPFLLVIEAVSTEKDLKPDDFLFQPVSLTVQRVDGQPRYFHGYTRRFTRGDAYQGSYHYILEVVPKLWFASQTSDDRIYHSLSVKDIITQILSDNGVTDKSFKITGSDPVRDFTVQYNETDLDFITRLMEEAGFFYFFEFAEGTHTLVIADSNSAFQAIDEPAMMIQAEASTVDALDHWRSADATAVGKVTLNDYDPLQPATPVTANTSTIAKTSGAAARDVTAWPALTDKQAVALARTKLRQEAAEAWSHLSQATGYNQHFAAGGKFTLSESDWTTVDTGDYVIRSVHHVCYDEAQGTGMGGAGYSNSFTCFPAAKVWRQPLSVPRPKMAGIFTAIVLGPSGEEIYTDEYGRIKVQLFWDHTPDATADNTIFVRVMQPWSGNQWGWQHIPRVGSEVAVAFVDGDPDHPIVVGSLYNANQKHPFPLPANKTKSGIKTRSSLNGGTADYNEFSFDDKKGSELVLLHAQKDHQVTVENDETVHIMHDQKITVDHDRTREVGNDETVTVKHDQTLTVTNNRTTEITTGNETLTVKTGDMATKVSTGNWDMAVSMGNMATKVDMGNVDLKVAMGNVTTKLNMGNWALDCGLGNVTVKADVGSISMEALQSIELKCGPTTSIKLDPMGVTIKGMMVSIEGTLMMDVKGLMTTVKGDAMTKVNGAIIMIGPG